MLFWVTQKRNFLLWLTVPVTPIYMSNFAIKQIPTNEGTSISNVRYLQPAKKISYATRQKNARESFYQIRDIQLRLSAVFVRQQ